MIIFYKYGKYIVLGKTTYIGSLLKYKVVDDVKIRFYYCDIKIGIYDLTSFIDRDGVIIDVLDKISKYKIKENEYELNPLDLEAEMYLQRIEDGNMLSVSMMAELRLNSVQNGLPREVNRYIENKLDRVKTNLDRGWWLSAKEELELVVVESYFTQELYDRIMNYFIEYISKNY